MESTKNDSIVEGESSTYDNETPEEKAAAIAKLMARQEIKVRMVRAGIIPKSKFRLAPKGSGSSFKFSSPHKTELPDNTKEEKT